MSKTKRTLIISSLIVALAFVVTVVSISAAWFGDMKSASTKSGFIIESDKLADSASIDISSSQNMEGQDIRPAIATPGYFLRQQIAAPTGAVLKNKDVSKGIEEGAIVATVYFPIQFVGGPDDGYEQENRKSLHIEMISANVGKMRLTGNGVDVMYEKTGKKLSSKQDLDMYYGDWTAPSQPTINFNGGVKNDQGEKINTVTYGSNSYTYTINKNDNSVTFGGYTATLLDYKSEFNVEVSLADAQFDADNKFHDNGTIGTSTYPAGGLKGNDVFCDCVGYNTYLLVQPGITYYVKADIYFNKIDEECNIDLLETVIRFNFKLNILSDGYYIRNGYTSATEGA